MSGVDFFWMFYHYIFFFFFFQIFFCIFWSQDFPPFSNWQECPDVGSRGGFLSAALSLTCSYFTCECSSVFQRVIRRGRIFYSFLQLQCHIWKINCVPLIKDSNRLQTTSIEQENGGKIPPTTITVFPRIRAHALISQHPPPPPTRISAHPPGQDSK